MTGDKISPCATKAISEFRPAPDIAGLFGSPIVAATLLLVASNVFMTFARYAHLKSPSAKPWYFAAMVSWCIALFEYLLQVPAVYFIFKA